MPIKNLLKKAFYNSPPIVRKLYASLPKKYIFGNVFINEVELLRKCQKSDPQFTNDIINERFLETIETAFNHIPFYQELYATYGVEKSLIKSIEDIGKLPVINKNLLKKTNLKTYNGNINSIKFLEANTGGSSGNPFSFFLPSNRYYRAWAYKIDMWGKAGYTFGQNVLSLRGHQFKKNLIQIQPLYNFHYVDSTKLNRSTVHSIYKYMNKNKIKYLHGYPSNITRLIEFFMIENLDISFVKGILPASEQVLQSQVELFRSAIYDVHIQPSYEQSEMTILATSTNSINEYEFYPTYGFPEILDEHDINAEEGRLIGTSFNNPIMPLIRYETGDQVSVVKKNKQAFLPPTVSISGRIGEYIYFNNTKHSLTGIIYGNHLPIFSFINELQVYQKGTYLALIFSMSEKSLDQKALQKTYKIIEDNTQGLLNIEMIQVNKEIKTGAGKYKLKITDAEFESLEIIRKF